MNDKTRKKNAKLFAEYWKDKGNEKSETQAYWNSLLRDVFDVKEPEKYIQYERPVVIDNKSFIDGYIQETKVLIEQKSFGIDLRKPEKQSDGSLLTPYEQGRRYANELPNNLKPNYIITCNFDEFIIYDENKNKERRGDTREVATFKLTELDKYYYLLDFLVDTHKRDIRKETQISFEAGQIVGKIYDSLVKQYLFIDEKDEDNNPTERAVKEQQSLNKLCVRLVFCLYAEDAGLFARKDQFHDYLKNLPLSNFRSGLIRIFKILNTSYEDRDPYLEEELNAFPYVNGGLFAEEDLLIPQFTEELKDELVEHASTDFDWSEISPTIFGAVFESTLNPETRRQGGVHYTSIENIHKVIDPLFLNDLKEELKEIKQLKQESAIISKIDKFQEKLSSLTFLDPAAGSGNFLTESYISLRKLENEAIKFRQMGKGYELAFEGANSPIKVSINQFYGIEINDFAVSVAKTALWIAEHQMLKETQEILYGLNLEFLPLHTNATIIEGNALRMDWNDVVPANKLNYIMGNPPFIGARLMNKNQKRDVNLLFRGIKSSGNIDYVGCWYIKASEYMKNTSIEAALVSTNSISQGEQPAILWEKIMNEGVVINFAHRTFRWDSEASIKAHVHCVIIGFSYLTRKKKVLYENDLTYDSKNINAYLVDAPNVFIKSKGTPSNIPEMIFGNMANDGGYLSNYTKEEKDEICKQFPEAECLFRKILGAEEFINNKIRYCLWLNKVSPKQYRYIKPIVEAINSVKEHRMSSKREATRKLAEVPYLFGEIRQSSSNYLIIPRVSSERRKYIPIGFVSPEIIASDAVQIIPNAEMWQFGILTSNVHMAWVRVVAGRLKSDYRYSAKIVYNNFPWPNLSDSEKEKIGKTAQLILDARNIFPNNSLADLYDDLTMPIELRKAHQENDKAVMKAYGFKTFMSEEKIVAELMKMYQNMGSE